MTHQKITAENAFEPENRRRYLGGTDISAILGYNPYRSAYDTWLEKTGRPVPERELTDILIFGHLLEPVIANEWLRRHPEWEIVAENEFTTDPEYPFLAANTDRIIKHRQTGELVVLECKSVASSAYKNWKLGVPITYYSQVQHYLGVKGFDRAIFVMLVMDSRQLEDFEVVRDDVFIDEIRGAAVEFWDNNIVKDVACDKTAYDWGQFRVKDEEVEADVETFASIIYLKRAKALKKKLDEKIKEHEEVIKLALQDKKSLVVYKEGTEDIEKLLCTWNGSDVERVDSKKLRAEFPEIAAKVLKSSFERKLLIK